MKKTIKYLIIFFASISLTACMATKDFTPENKQSIHKIIVDKDVTVPKDITYIGPGIGYVGLLSAPMSMSTAEEIKTLAAKNNIKIENIVRDEFINDIKHDTKLIIVDQGKADANLKIDVVSYGFIVPQGLSFEVSPTIWINAKLVQGGATVWENHYRVSGGFYTMKSYKTDDLLNNPKLVSSAWHDATEKAVKEIIKNLS